MSKRTAAFDRRQKLGQFWTPPELAALLTAQLSSRTTLALDLAAGEGALLDAMRSNARKCKLVGCDIDPDAILRAAERIPSIKISLADGLRVAMPRRSAQARMAAVANPPFGEADDEALGRSLLRKAFPDVESEFGIKRLEMQFLARYLVWARNVNGMISILMPSGFSDGDMYRKFRASLMNSVGLRRVIEIAPSSFVATEARCSLLVIDAALRSTNTVQICRYDEQTKQVVLVYEGPIEPGERLDARYHLGKTLVNARTPTLKDIGVEVVRGTFSNSEARRQQVHAIHTTHLASARRGNLRLGASVGYPDDAVMATAGDILLPRTGTRVAWRPTVVSAGLAPITDHVFRIRAPQTVRQTVRESFNSPLFERWLDSVSKGVCATVLTKRELLEMPAFALA
jgi:predicted RNA methylase